jgi:uracil-DNA glycosylase family 4
VTDLVAAAVQRSAVLDSIRSCRACDLAPPACRAPVPFRGPTPNPRMILGEAPGATEDKQGKPFVGESGQLLAQMIDSAGLPSLDSWFIANTVCCRSIGPPEPEQKTACQNNLRDLVGLCEPEWVLVLGATALSALGCVSTKITDLHGHPFRVPAGIFKDTWVMPTFHPATALRSENKSAELANDLSTLSRLWAGKMSFSDVEARIGRGGKATYG